MTLLALQKDFREALLADDAMDGARFGADAVAGLNVYRNAYRGRLMECLRTSYDKVWGWIGDEAFDAAACHHIILHPPQSWTLDFYGEGFERTLATLFPDDPEVSELAWLEQAMQRAFASLDQPIITAGDLTSGELAAINWDHAQLGFVSSFQLREFRTNCIEIWLSIANDTDAPDALLLDEPISVAVWRKEFSPQFRMIDPNEQKALTLLMNGGTFGELCDEMAARLGVEAAASATGAMLGRWIGEEMISSIRC